MPELPRLSEAALVATIAMLAISQTITALALSYARDLAPVIADIRASGVTSLGGIATELNARHIQTRRGGKWYASGVANVLARLG
jgi:hypothetical protein